ncbi:MAG: Gfo/Idh/MocA family oxidoreductase [Planctomycetota bacterium]
MPDTPIHVCLIGQKFMGRTHSNAYSQVGKFFDLARPFDMHTICGRDRDDLEAFRQRWGWHNASVDWKEAVANPDIELVDIGTPNHVHRDMAIASLEAGKHVACEKPLANTLDAAREMRDAAASAKGTTSVWYNYRRCPSMAFAHQLVASGKLGRIYHVRGFYLQDWAGPDAPLVWRFQGDVAGSGSLGDLCAHSIDSARFITGLEFETVGGAVLKTFIEERPIPDDAGGEISGKGASGGSKMGKSTVDDAVIFTAGLTGGAIATFEATRLSTGNKNGNRLEIHGEKGAIRWNFARMGELEWYDATLPDAEQGWSTIRVSDGSVGHPYAAAYWPVGHHIGYEHSFVNQAADINAVLSGNAPVVPLPDFADAYETQRVLAAVTKSAETKAVVSLSDIA